MTLNFQRMTCLVLSRAMRKETKMTSDIQTLTKAPAPMPALVTGGTVSSSSAAPQGGAATPSGKTPALEHPKLMTPKKVELTLNPEERERSLKAALAELNQQAASSKQHLGFRMDSSIHGPVITVHNTQTGEVVRQIPSQVELDIAHSIDSLKGVLFSKKI